MKASIKASFKVLNTNSKNEISIGLVIKGDLTDAQLISLNRLKAVGAVFVDIFDGQASIEDYEYDDVTSEEHNRGISYTMDNGTVQLSIDDLVNVHKDILDEPLHIDADANVIPKESPYDVNVRVLKPFGYHDNHEIGEIISVKAYDFDELVNRGMVEFVMDDGEPSEDEKEIESMRSEAEDDLEEELPF